MKVAIDRFEGSFAVCETENKEMINIEKDKLPSDVKEGDILFVDGDNISIDKVATENQKNKIEQLMNDLWQ